MWLVNPESDWFIRTLNQTHTCLQIRKLRACTASLICKKIIDQVEADLKIPLRAICNARRSGLVNLETISVKNDFLIEDYLG
uniref:Uncharacterized protein n=1 Tax=Lactuca sativa TaxID=4236 RepID=A0A9R1WNE8_LACSA|nr:hypothetical protein LSAT_V11C100015990 [Lactuca sativa]